MHIAIEIKDQTGATERMVFDLVPDKQANFSSGLISERAPLAQAILGRTSGETVQYLPPSGAQQTVTILTIEQSGRASMRPDSDRVQALEQVKDRIARRESRQIALTTELHYGSIDPDGIKDE
ncbi:MAG TPA: GreA/GreB family elongation factor [Anaerolineae bacterium]